MPFVCHFLKSARRSGAIRYANRTARGRCPHRGRFRPGKQRWKEVDLSKDQLEKPCRPWHEATGTTPDRTGVAKGKYHFETTKVAVLRISPNVSRATLRMGISEHPL